MLVFRCRPLPLPAALVLDTVARCGSSTIKQDVDLLSKKEWRNTANRTLMKGKEELIREGYQVFSDTTLPISPTVENHGINEIIDWENTLRGVTREELKIEDLGNEYYHPLYFLNPEALAYYTPRFIEFCVTGARLQEDTPFADLFVFFLSDAELTHFSEFTHRHLSFIYEALLFINRHRDELFDDLDHEYFSDQEFEDAIERWRSFCT